VVLRCYSLFADAEFTTLHLEDRPSTEGLSERFHICASPSVWISLSMVRSGSLGAAACSA
jgi:hypothetical protein